MAINYPVNISNTKWAVIRQSTGEIISRNQTWPRSDGQEIQGLDPDYVYLLDVRFLPSSHPQYVAQPNYDSRLYYLVATETPNIPNNVLNLQWSSVKRGIEEQTESALNKETEVLSSIIDFSREIIETRLAVSAILTQLSGQNLPQKAVTFVNDYRQKGIKIWNNRGRLSEILNEINNSIEPNLDAGWDA